jgi:hypothetical protein
MIDHGAFSSFILLKCVYELYKDNPNWNIDDFYYEVVDSATAIFLHIAYKYADLAEIFGNGKFEYDSPNPLGFLLFLSDSVCEWLRGKRRNLKKYGIKVNGECITFKMPKSKQKKIEDSVLMFDNRLQIKFEN